MGGGSACKRLSHDRLLIKVVKKMLTKADQKLIQLIK